MSLKRMWPPRKSPYYSLWRNILDEHIGEKQRILDIGCGCGQFAKLSIESGHQCAGLDKDTEGIMFATERVPEAVFHVVDVTENQTLIRDGNYDTITFIQVLEHLDDDLAILATIPKGKRVVLSVPNFDDVDHRRFFDGMESVVERYCEFILCGKRRIIPDPWCEEHERYVISGVRK